MKLSYTRLLEGDCQNKVLLANEFSQAEFVELLATSKALLIRSKDETLPLTIDDFASIIVDLNLKHYPYEGEFLV
jgi:hypothetical protein